MIPKPRPDIAELLPWQTADRVSNASFISLHLNENPYPPPQAVLEAIAQETMRNLRTFPDTECSELVATVAKTLAIHEDQLLFGNGSTELQRCIMLAFAQQYDKIGFLWPSSAYYMHLAKIHGCVPTPLYCLDFPEDEAIFNAPDDIKILFIASPNTPSGVGIDTDVIANFAKTHPQTLVVVDEAYEAFRGDNVLKLVQNFYPNVLVTRSFSKAYSLAGLRIGFVMGHQATIASLKKISAPYAVGGTAQVAALAAWQSTDWLTETVNRIRATREHVRMEVQMRGFEVTNSEANFIYMRGTDPFRLERGLRDRNIIVRRYDEFEMRDGVRVTIGTEEQMDLFISSLDYLVSSLPMRNSSSSTNIRKIRFSDLEESAPVPAPGPPPEQNHSLDEVELDPDLEL